MNIESPAFKTAEAIYAAVNHSKGMRHAGHKPETYARLIDELLERVARHVGSLQIMSGDTYCFANAVREYKADFGEDSRPELERVRSEPRPMVARVPFTKFNQTRMVPLRIMVGGHEVKNPEPTWTDTLWVEDPIDLWALMHSTSRTLVVNREDWLRSPVCKEDEG